jgi:hypothetical protein
MRHWQLVYILWVALVAGSALGDEPQPAVPHVDAAALESRLADLERQLVGVLNELRDIRGALHAPRKTEVCAMTPAEAIESFKQSPNQLVTVEFGVESAGWLDGPIPIGEDPMPPILADWEGRLPNGGKFSLHLTAKAIRGLNDVEIDLPPQQPVGFLDPSRLGVLSKQLNGKGVRATGLIKAHRPGDPYSDYSIVVDDPANFRVNK